MCAACPRALSLGFLLPFCKDKILWYTERPVSWNQIYSNRPGITQGTCLVDPCPKQNAGSSTATVLIGTWLCFRTLKSAALVLQLCSQVLRIGFECLQKGHLVAPYSLPSSVTPGDKTQPRTSSYQHFRTNPQCPSSPLCSIQQ